MTVEKAIEQAGTFRPNQYNDATLAGWLSELDGKIYRDIMSTHEDCPEEAPDEYVIDAEAETDDSETELLVAFPDANLYVLYLIAKIDWANGDFDRYNNDLLAFNNAYDDFINAYNQAHLPVQNNALTFWGNQDEDDELPDELT